jgi:hypothetical protein
MRSTLKYSISLVALLLLSLPALAQDEDSSVAIPKNLVVPQNQFNIAVDFFHPVINSFSNAKKSYEVVLDYALPKDVYAVIEGGFGSAAVNYTTPDLKYTSTNSFVRIGVNKSMLQRLSVSDWDIVFIGLRYGVAFINRSEAQYSIDNQYFGNVYGIIPAKNMTAHWIELTGGMRVELFKNVFAGYNVRAKFIMNGKSLKELAPYNIAGFGKGEKTAIFDFNMYLGYSIRWYKQGMKPASKDALAPTVPR